MDRRPRVGLGHSPDIDVIPPEGPIPLSRLAPERALRRVDRYDRRAELIAYETLTPTGTVRLTFRVLDDHPFLYDPGYFVGIVTSAPGKGVRRSPYCIVSPPTGDRTFQLLVRLVPEGPVSIYLASLRVGDVMPFRGPSGRSMVPKEGDEELVMLSTGVGVGPLMALVHHLAALGVQRQISLYWGLRLVDDICLIDELDDLTRRYPTFSYRISLSQPPPGWDGLRGRLTESVPPLLGELGGRRYYLVGNGAMIEEVSLVLSDLGVDRSFIHQEVYFNVRHRADPRVLAEIRRRFLATDLFSPHAHQEAGLLFPENPISRRDRPSSSLQQLLGQE
ncbi:MAG: ferredoxin--NADP reductase [Acidimicrobiales bacterium]